MNLILDFIVAAVLAGTPLLFGTVGEILNERVGHLNLGVEGMMSIGACTGFLAGYQMDSLLLALVAAFLGGALGALIYAVLTVTFMANQNVVGLALTTFGIGLSNFVGYFMVGKSQTGSLKLPAHISSQIKNVHISGLGDIPVLGKLLFSYNPFVYVGIVIALICGFILFRTKLGLNIRSIGENPSAADAAGIPVNRLKYLNIVIGGGICGIGGAYTLMITNGGVWLPDCVGGLGWIAVALVIFAGWRPQIAIWGSFVFGAFRILKYYVPKSLPVPNAFYDMLPFLITAIVLVVSSMQKRKKNTIPANCGVNYFREDR